MSDADITWSCMSRTFVVGYIEDLGRKTNRLDGIGTRVERRVFSHDGMQEKGTWRG